MSSPRSVVRVAVTAALVVLGVALAGCSSTTGNVALGAVGATLLGARSPAHEIEQIYYLGVFDPRGQVPEMIYRVTVKGQASFISNTKYASGWVPAPLVDSLSSGIKLSARAGAGEAPTITAGGAETMSSLQTGRRLVLFGPEGFREAPRDHRLVIVMGTSPEKFFQAIDTALGEVADVQIERDNSQLQREIFQALLAIKDERSRLKDFQLELPEQYRKK